MVRAILAGAKSQTRRMVRTHPASGYIVEPGGKRRWHRDDPDAVAGCPYGRVGDRLWVREALTYVREDPVTGEDCTDVGIHCYTASIPPGYDSANPWRGDNYLFDRDGVPHLPPRNISPIHMPRWASRLTLEITDVRVQRLQEISYEDAIAEGAADYARGREDHVELTSDTGETWEQTARRLCWPQRAFERLWDSINAKRAPWSSNPWVWAITFRRIMQ